MPSVAVLMDTCVEGQNSRFVNLIFANVLCPSFISRMGRAMLPPIYSRQRMTTDLPMAAFTTSRTETSTSPDPELPGTRSRETASTPQNTLDQPPAAVSVVSSRLSHHLEPQIRQQLFGAQESNALAQQKQSWAARDLSIQRLNLLVK